MKKIINFLDKYLEIYKFNNDYANNGLQVKNKKNIKKICLAVDISLNCINFAKKNNCDLIITHHGLSWSDSLKYITGRNYLILRELIKNSMGLYSVHAPLDVHPMIGNNVQIIKLLDSKNKIKKYSFGLHKGINWGYSIIFSKEISKTWILKKLELINKKPITFLFKPIKKIGVISGGGSFSIEEAYEKGYDTIITGETSHQNIVIAKDLKINLIFLGHYKSEILGIKALGKLLKKKFKIGSIFFEDDTKF